MNKSLLLTGIVVLLFISCDSKNDDNPPDPDSKCGTASKWYANYHVEDDIVYDELFGNLRSIQYGLDGEPEDICRDEHVLLTYMVETNGDTALPGLVVRGLSSWGLYGHTKTVPWSSTPTPKYFGLDDVGLQQGFQENEPGYIDLNVELTFPTTGSLASDKLWVKNHIRTIYASCSYKQKK